MVDAAPDPKCPGCQTLLRRVERLEREIEQLKAAVRQNSSNSNRPPSSDPPWSKPPTDIPPSGRRRGAQPGHKKSERDLLPPDELQSCMPRACESCGAELFGEDSRPHRHQVTELPPARALVTEYQLHALECKACGHRTRARLPDGVPMGAFGPRLQSMVTLLTGGYRVSRRNAQQLMADAFGVEMSLGAISAIESATTDILAEPHRIALQAVHRAAIVHSDETSWRESGRAAWLWTAVAVKLSVFLIRRSRGGDVARELIGAEFKGTHVSDRWSGYEWIPIDQRQVC